MTQVEEYLKYLRHERNYSRHTEISYYTDLCQFESFITGIVGSFDVEQIDSDIVRRWVVSLMEQKVSPRSISRKLSGVNSFYNYLLEHHLVAHNPARGIKAPKANKPLPSFANYVDMKPLLDEELFIKDAGCQFEAARDHTLVELLYVTGMRRDELIKLRDADVDFSAQQLLVNGKRNKQRIIPFSPKTTQMLKRYLDIRNQEIAREADCFFVLENGKPLYPMLVYRIVHRCLENISTLSKASPHVLRHSFATGMLNNGAEINAVKELLGHSSLASTEIYTHTSVEELKKIYEKAHPRA
jgi:integrase/recombinase XerC